jgi:uncharacterized protein YggU (UPF0235/DUF167 family)
VIRFHVHVYPGARTASVGGAHDGSLKVHVVARAVDGAATNDVLLALAQAFEVRPNAVTCVRGRKSREKSIVIEGSDRHLARRLEHLLTR